MARYGGVPTEYQEDGYLAQISASTNQKNAVAAQRGANHGHKIPIDKIKEILSNTA